jgi:hypothetical protein
MPPQQGDALLDLVNHRFDFRAHLEPFMKARGP